MGTETTAPEQSTDSRAPGWYFKLNLLTWLIVVLSVMARTGVGENVWSAIVSLLGVLSTSFFNAMAVLGDCDESPDLPRKEKWGILATFQAILALIYLMAFGVF